MLWSAGWEIPESYWIDGWSNWVRLSKVVALMSHKLMALAAVIAIACLSFLLLSPMERESFFLTRYLGKAMFPKLARDQRQRRMSFIAGTLLCSLVVAGVVVFLIKHLSRR